MTTLQDISLFVTDGKHGDCQNQEDSGYYFISCKDVKDGWIDYSGARQITEEDYLDTHRRTRLEPDDILITNSGTIGRIALIRKTPETNRTTFQKSVAIIKPDKNNIIPRWLYYYLNAKKDALISSAGGTAQKNLLLRDLRAFQLSVPLLTNQRKIAAILSAYDDLIENNLRRIKIHEEMAQNLYREWFVNFRFPGYEKAKMIDSAVGMIPEAWEVHYLANILFTIESGSRPKGGVSETSGEIPSIGAENIIGLGKYDYSKNKFVTQEFFNNMRRGHVRHKDVLLYKDGAQIGRKTMFRNEFPYSVCCVNEHVFILRANSSVSQNYLYFWLDQPENTQKIKNLNANAAQPGINQEQVKGLQIVIPTRELLERFERILEPLLELLFNLSKKNQNLRQTRDLLLPKLTSGELDVSYLDVKVGAAE